MISLEDHKDEFPRLGVGDLSTLNKDRLKFKMVEENKKYFSSSVYKGSKVYFCQRKESLQHWGFLWIGDRGGVSQQGNAEWEKICAELRAIRNTWWCRGEWKYPWIFPTSTSIMSMCYRALQMLCILQKICSIAWGALFWKCSLCFISRAVHPYLHISGALSLISLLNQFQSCVSFLQGTAFGQETLQSILLMMSQIAMAILCLQFLLVSTCSWQW